MNTSAFIGIMLIIIFAFIAGMIWAYRKNEYKETKKEFKSEVLNSFDATLNSITVHTDDAVSVVEDEETDSQEEKDKTSEIELESRKKIIQEKNHIKKSAADEYFERTKKMANEILQPKK